MGGPGEWYTGFMMDKIPIFLEVGKKKVFAGAPAWPGWCRWGRDEAAAIQALVDYAPRYAAVLRGCDLGFHAPRGGHDFTVAERHPGDASTDFGAPAAVFVADHQPMGPAGLGRSQVILLAAWMAFDRAADAAQGAVLRTGPRGGGRTLEKIMAHVIEADLAYLKRLAWKFNPDPQGDQKAQIRETREAIQAALDSAVRQGLPESGPRGGVIWTPVYFVRRVAWHVLDHAWEIEDRTVMSEQ